MSKGQPERIYRLADCEAVFAVVESFETAILVGGQAVYFWATQFRAACPELDRFLPYTSKDADYLADLPTAYSLAHALHRQFKPASRKGGMLGLSLGHIPLDNEMQVEILGHVNGLREAELREQAVILAYHGMRIKVIHPLDLFVGKGCSLIDLDQSDRQDGKHFAIMQWVVRRFLADLAEMGEEGIEALLISCELLVRFTLKEVGLKLVVGGHLPSLPLWPDLSEHPSEKVQNFVRHRAPRWEQRLALEVEKFRLRMTC